MTLSDSTKSNIRLALRSEIERYNRLRKGSPSPFQADYFLSRMQDNIHAYEEFTGETYVHFK